MENYNSQTICEERGVTVYVAGPLTDTQLGYMYLRMLEEGLLKTVFFVNPDITLSEFIRWHRNPSNLHLGVFYGPAIQAGESLQTDKVRLAGVGWFNSVSTEAGVFRKAEVGMCFFKEYANVWFTRIATSMLIDYCFYSAKIDVLFGTTPLPNRAALLFSRRMGFDLTGPLPDYTAWMGEKCPVYISHMNKETWAMKGKRIAAGAEG